MTTHEVDCRTAPEESFALVKESGTDNFDKIAPDSFRPDSLRPCPFPRPFPLVAAGENVVSRTHDKNSPIENHGEKVKYFVGL